MRLKLRRGRAGLWLLALLLIFFLAAPAFAADTSEASNQNEVESAKALHVFIINQGQVSNYIAYDMDALKSMPQTEATYSSIDRFPTQVQTKAQGVTMLDLLDSIAADTGVGFDKIERSGAIRLVASDGWYSKYSYAELDAERYYYAGIFHTGQDGQGDAKFQISNDPESKVDWTIDVDYVLGYEKEIVPAMLALESAQARIVLNPQSLSLSSKDRLRFCIGQTATDLRSSASTTHLFGRGIYRLEISLDGSTVGGTNNSGVRVPVADITPNSTNMREITAGEKLLRLNEKTSETLRYTAVPYEAGFAAEIAAYGIQVVSSDPGIASFNASDNAIEAKKVGTATFTVTLPAYTQGAATYAEVVKQFTVEVVGADVDTGNLKDGEKPTVIKVESISLSDSKFALIPGVTRKIKATVLPEDAADKSLKWASGDFMVATVDQNGVVTGRGYGTTTITATTADGNFEAGCVVTVSGNEVKVLSVGLDKNKLYLTPRRSAQLHAVLNPSYATNVNLLWSSDQPAVVTVDTEGKVTALGLGMANITVTTVDGGYTASCVVNVVEKETQVSGVTIERALHYISVGERWLVPLTISPEEATNPTVSWSSSAPIVATVDASGYLVAKTPGETTITVTTEDGGFTASCIVTVTGEQNGAGFHDTQGHWAQNAIETLASLGLINGYAQDNTFRPQNTITRAEFATILMRVLATTREVEAGGNQTFPDTVNHWAKSTISQVVALDIADGYASGNFGPNDPVTREQMAVMIDNAYRLPPSAIIPTFADSNQLSAWATDAVAAVVAAKLLAGYEDGTFRPQHSATRAEVATIMLRMLQQEGYL